METDLPKIVDWNQKTYNEDDHYERSTTLKAMLGPHGARGYWYARYCKPEDDPALDPDETLKRKKEFVVGDLFDILLLDGREPWVTSTLSGNSNKYKDLVDEKSAEGIAVIRPRDERMLFAWRDSVMRIPEAREMIEKGSQGQQAILFNYEGIDCKVRMDMFSDDGEIWDVKTFAGDTREEFEKQCRDFRYDLSSAMYEIGRDSYYEGCEGAAFKHLVVSKKWPYYAYLWPLDEGWLRIGRRHFKQAIQAVKDCRERQAEYEALGRPAIEAWPDRQVSSDPSPPPPWHLADMGINPDEY